MEHECPGCGNHTQNIEKEGTDISNGSGHGHAVRLMNCNCHSFGEVEVALAAAGIPNGKRFATLIHNKGSAIVYEGESQKCEAVAMILESHGLEVKLQ